MPWWPHRNSESQGADPPPQPPQGVQRSLADAWILAGETDFGLPVSRTATESISVLLSH